MNKNILPVENSQPVKEIKTFEVVAKEIIKKSIRSAVCIDDIFVEPYMDDNQISHLRENLEKQGLILDFNTPSNLYKSFRQDGECDLDIYNFESIEKSWHPEYILNNKDLVILDWELEGQGNYDSTLFILNEIIKNDKIPFVIIYTQKPKQEFFEISSALISNFNIFNKENQSDLKDIFYSQFNEHLIKISSDDSWDDDKVELFWDKSDIKFILLEFILKPLKKKSTIANLKEEIIKEFNINNEASLEKKIKTVLKNTFNADYYDSIEKLTYLLSESNNIDGYLFKRIDIEEIGFKINNCIVTIFQKTGEDGSGINPNNVFIQFSNLVSSSPHNFITLLSIEMRDRFREDLSKIGNNISLIDEKAFFWHLEHYKKRSPENYENLFFDFLLNSWTNELSEYNINLKPLVFDVIDEYRKLNFLEEIKGIEIINSLARLANKLSTTKINDRYARDNKIRFGDIFKIKLNGESENEEYYLSITPHCICLDSCKIDNNFYFIRSENVSNDFTSALKKVETDHYSFIEDDSLIKAIKWGDCKPFTSYITENNLKNLKSSFKNIEIELLYVTTLKENFAQRIANKSFSYGTSIGIDLPNLS
nr:response regulator receiver domain [uncultured Flavobacterium sp.]